MSDTISQGKPCLPAYEFLRKLQKENFAAVNEISRIQFSTGITAIHDPTLSDDDRKKTSEAKEQLKELIELVASMQYEGRPEGFEPGWGIMYYRDLLDTVANNERTVLQKVAFGLLYSHSANGWALHHESGDIIILDAVLYPLFDYLNSFTLLCIQRSIQGNQFFSGYWMAQSLLPHILYFTTDFPPSKIPWPQSPTELGLAFIKTWTYYQLNFIIAHEMGHVVLGHNNNKIVKLAARPGLDNKKIGQIHHYDRNQVMELEADEYAANLCYAHAEKRQDNLSRCRVAIELLFIYLSAIENTSDILRSKLSKQNVMITPIESHPQARRRLEALRLAKPKIRLDGDNLAIVSFMENLLLDSWLTSLNSRNREEIALLIQALQKSS